MPDFAPAFTTFRHDAQGAVAKLLRERCGECPAALHHPEVGDIDLVWGEGGEKGYGLAHIYAKHPEMLGRDLQEFLAGLRRIDRGPEVEKSRATLASSSAQAVVRLDWDGKPKLWLVTAFEFPKRQS